MDFAISPESSEQPSPGRRQFIQFAALGAGISLLSATPWVLAAGEVKALLLSCIDYRLIDETNRYMNSRGLSDQYDHFILAGASLGAVTKQHVSWVKTFWAHLDLAIDLHKVPRLIVMDHRDCGAYRLILGQDFVKEPEKETQVHEKHLKKLATLVKQKYPKLEVELHLIALDGSVETFS